MIKFLHAICKIGMGIWTIICGLMAITPIMAMFKTTSTEESAAMGTASVLVWLFLGALWFFPMLGMVIAAYFTRPQAWEKNEAKPAMAPVQAAATSPVQLVESQP